MLVVKPGVMYRLFNFGSQERFQTIQFTEKISEGHYAEGTTNEELVEVLIDRFYHLQKQKPSPINSTCIELLKVVRQTLAKRRLLKSERVARYHESLNAGR